jgi:hypothetical protein
MYLATCIGRNLAACRQSFFEKFRRQAPVKSAIAKMIKKLKNGKKSCEERGETCR